VDHQLIDKDFAAIAKIAAATHVFAPAVCSSL